MDAPCAHACDCFGVYVYFKLTPPAHGVDMVLQAFIPTTARPRLNFNQLLSVITAMVLDPNEAYTRSQHLDHAGCSGAVICPGSGTGTGHLWLWWRGETLLPDRNDSCSAPPAQSAWYEG